MIRFQTVIASFNVTTGASFNLQNNKILEPANGNPSTVHVSELKEKIDGSCIVIGKKYHASDEDSLGTGVKFGFISLGNTLATLTIVCPNAIANTLTISSLDSL